MRFETTITRKVALDYLLYLPKEYDANGVRRFPLIVFLHGAGERGSDLQLVTKHGPPMLVKDRPDFPFVVVSPQCPAGQTWDIDVLNGLLDEVLAKHAIDARKVFLTGLSMGGYGAWKWAIASPQRFAAVAPICGGGDPLGVRLAGGDQLQALKRLPIWAFHGAKDNVVKLSESERMVDAFKQIGDDARLTVYPEAGHDSWSETYLNQELYDWFLKQTSAR